jgi:hypothetical protein
VFAHMVKEKNLSAEFAAIDSAGTAGYHVWSISSHVNGIIKSAQSNHPLSIGWWEARLKKCRHLQEAWSSSHFPGTQGRILSRQSLYKFSMLYNLPSSGNLGL